MVDVNDRRTQRRFRSICETLFVCKRCARIVHARSGAHSCQASATVLFDNNLRKNSNELRRQRANATNFVAHNTLGRTLRTNNEHWDNPLSLCKKCGIVHTVQRPYCFIQPIVDDPADERRRVLYVFFDCETTQCESMPDDDNHDARIHRCNLLIAHVVCTVCLDAGLLDPQVGKDQRPTDCFCPRTLRNRRQVYNTFDENDEETRRYGAIDAFLDYLLHKGPVDVPKMVISHNGGKFDIHLCLERLHAQSVPVKLVTTGLRIFCMEIRKSRYRNVIFKDSLLFFHSALAALPRAFGFVGRVPDKPFFPHLFNRPENIDVQLHGRLPDLDYYAPDEKSPEERKRLIEWHAAENARLAQQQNNAADVGGGGGGGRCRGFHLRVDLVEYCENDVNILKWACHEFRRRFLEIANCDPFLVASTIAKLALHVYRKKFLRPDTLLNVPEGGFRRCQMQSVVALRYMRLFELQHNTQVRTCMWSVGEACFPDGSERRMDGYVDRGPNKRPLAIEFLGCLWHGCPTCYPQRDTVLMGGFTAEHLYDATMQRIYHLNKNCNYDVHLKWDCDFKKELRENVELNELYEDCCHAVNRPLDPRRDALRGGRTEAFKLYYKCKPNEEIVCMDVVRIFFTTRQLIFYR